MDTAENCRKNCAHLRRLPNRAQHAAPLQGKREKNRSEDRPLRRSAGDEEFEGAGDDAEFDGEAGERFAIDLGVDWVLIDGLADDRIGFEEFNACGAAEFSQPKRGQIAEIAEAAASGESEDFEAVFEEIGFGSDFERSTVVLRAADDDQ